MATKTTSTWPKALGQSQSGEVGTSSHSHKQAQSKIGESGPPTRVFSTRAQSGLNLDDFPPLCLGLIHTWPTKPALKSIIVSNKFGALINSDELDGKASNTDGDEFENLVVPLVGLGDSQDDSLRSPYPPPLVLSPNRCNINKEVSSVPSVSVSLDYSEQDLDAKNTHGTAKNSSGTAGNSLAEKSGSAGGASFPGLSVSDSPGSPGVLTMHKETMMGSSPSEELSGFRSAGNTGGGHPAFFSGIQSSDFGKKDGATTS
ncbi:hypothetical protein L1987_01183 [Smallanthus sonchifolius]|uniref:Uncharacterized protein n=1 Tax=Smallanthus sonchifolius TaxID=185202 RepID=A0ACB9K4K2_9ASTR|nr:hypothetical protein L1987_01183 [Smallanthus sonchifolius]